MSTPFSAMVSEVHRIALSGGTADVHEKLAKALRDQGRRTVSKDDAYDAVVKKYPDLAASKTKESTFMPGTSPLPGMNGGPPGGMSASMPGMAASPMGKSASATERLGGLLSKMPSMHGVGQHLSDHAHAYDLAGLGVLAVPSALELGHEAHKGAKGEKVNKGAVGKAMAEVGGLGVLAAPGIAQLALGHH